MDAKQKYELCLRITSEALEKLELIKDTELARTLLKFAKDYYEDAKHYASKGQYATALEAIAYAHGFVDAGVLSGLFHIPGYHLKPVEGNR